MRVIFAGISVLALGCAPLREPSPCRKPCPASCPVECLDSGYCATVSFTAPKSPRIARAEGGVLNFALGDLPPGAPVRLEFDAGLDLLERGDTTPWDYWFRLRESSGNRSVDAIEVAAFNAVTFPVPVHWVGEAVTDASGNLDERLSFTRCRGREGRHDADGCTLSPGSTFTATLLDPTPWSRAPDCP